MEALEKIGLYNKNIGIQSVYQNMIANIDRSQLNHSILTIEIVKQLRSMVVVQAKAGQRVGITSDRLTKAEFVHLVWYISEKRSQV